ncbi:carbohydrate ABC transporter ATP-binding protein (CUT1 family) [Paraburkholderia sp. BL6669N2]|uniref:ABC transporter ATP-binding protein n=1 Tax=unclassified Paraburkholderia TaxID=2615204 RepID=UPI000E26CB09|nr:MULTISPECIES: ABC transporter ATP-binding protein [unclassified Paraburkholderia]REG58131.1 carbohydrate ABC transporter ATP-binding protein (CUT1 family) [Paraburkholderia sp. BL6669N2]TDY26699.1 carbohydrate ABC transporter ATP-binding protein (CUT1 family) [Paraburkholderia sp. BL6665CI2N2]
MSTIVLANLHKRFDDFVAVRDTSLTIGAGRFVVLLGPSGCGKTTTLRMIAGLELPTSGQILIDGEDVTALRARQRDIAFVFQMFALYPHMTVRNNIAFPLKNEHASRKEIAARVDAAAHMLRIENILDRKTGGLSGGDRQRVALGRAIVRQPKAFLMDEPLGTLDADFRELMCLELRKLHNALAATTVYVTHDQSEAMAMADDIVVMNKGELLQAGPPHEIYHFPATVFVGNFIGSPPMNFLPVDGGVDVGHEEVRLHGARVPVSHCEAAAERVLLGIRPEHVAIDQHGPLRGKVIADEYLGSHQVLVVETALGVVRVRVGKDDGLPAGSPVGLSFRKERTLLYDAQSGRLLPGAAHTIPAHGEAHG